MLPRRGSTPQRRETEGPPWWLRGVRSHALTPKGLHAVHMPDSLPAVCQAGNARMNQVGTEEDGLCAAEGHRLAPQLGLCTDPEPVPTESAPGPHARSPRMHVTSPTVQTRSSATQTRSPAMQTRSSATQTRSPATQMRSPAMQTRSSATQTRSSATQTGSSATQTTSPALQTGSSALQTASMATYRGLSPRTVAGMAATFEKEAACDDRPTGRGGIWRRARDSQTQPGTSPFVRRPDPPTCPGRGPD